MSFLTTTQFLSTETPLPEFIDLKSALGLLHDHATFQNLQPLATENKLISTPENMEWLTTKVNSLTPNGIQPEYRSVTVAVPLGPFGSNNIVTTSAFIDTDDGHIVVFQAPLGLYGHDQWRVVSSTEGKGLILKEESTLTGFALLMPFVMGTKKKSHAELGQAFVRKLEERATK